jgi:hypothetical protein
LLIVALRMEERRGGGGLEEEEEGVSISGEGAQPFRGDVAPAARERKEEGFCELECALMRYFAHGCRWVAP